MSVPEQSSQSHSLAEEDLIDEEDDFSTIRNRHQSFSDGEEQHDHWDGEGDYSSRMEEIFSDNGDSDNGHDRQDGMDDDEEFVYTGKDADEPTGGYRDQLKDVLESELGSDDALSEKQHLARNSLPQSPADGFNVFEAARVRSSPFLEDSLKPHEIHVMSSSALLLLTTLSPLRLPLIPL